jgi:hypothetical protein
MNGWDLFTQFSSFGLGISAVLIFGYFLRDARSLLDQPNSNSNSNSDPNSGEDTDSDSAA